MLPIETIRWSICCILNKVRLKIADLDIEKYWPNI